MDLSEISFCNGIGYNLKNIRYKSDIIKHLFEKFKIELNDNYKIYNDKDKFKLSKYEYLISLKTIGASYYMFLTRIKNKNYTLFIDKKLNVNHKFPKIIIVNYRFKDHLYNNTIFTGELVKYDNNWHFIFNDILVYNNKKLNINFNDRIKLIYNILNKFYIKDPVLENCNLLVKRYFNSNQYNYLVNKYLKNIGYKIIAVIFTPVYSNSSSIIFNFKYFKNNYIKIDFLEEYDSYNEYLISKNKLLENNIPEIQNEIRSENDILLDLLVEDTVKEQLTDEFTFKVLKSKFPNIFILYCLKNNNEIKNSIARIDTLECLEFIEECLKNKKEYINCVYNLDFNKWIPISVSNKDQLNNFKEIQNYISSKKK